MRKWVLNFIEITIFTVIFMVCIVSILQSTILKDKDVFGFRTYVIASNSMYPVLEYGDVILVKDVNYENIKVDDIITYMGKIGEFKDKVITHEVIEIFYEDNIKVLKTKGRANTGIDPSVYEEQVYGRVVYRFVLLSFMSKIVRNELGFVLFIFIPFGILFILEFINMVKETKRRELEKLVKNQLEELKKLDNSSKEIASLENTVCLQLEQIKDAKRDFKKMNELEYTVRVPLEDVKKEIEKLKNKDIIDNDKVNDINLEDTVFLFDSEDIKKEIVKELKNKNKKGKRTRKRKTNK